MNKAATRRQCQLKKNSQEEAWDTSLWVWIREDPQAPRQHWPIVIAFGYPPEPHYWKHHPFWLKGIEKSVSQPEIFSLLPTIHSSGRYSARFWGWKKPTMFLFSAIMQGLPCHTLPGLSDLQNWRGRLFEPFAFMTQKPSPWGQHCQVRLTYLVGNSLTEPHL